MQEDANIKIKGMNRDLSVANFSSEAAYENKNFRVMAIDESTMMSLVNEKGNRYEGVELKGVPIGYSVINDYGIIFTTPKDKNTTIVLPDDDKDIEDIDSEDEDIDIDTIFNDKIYKVWYDEDTLKSHLLFTGDLNFDYKYPIETIPYYENEDIQKVYWVDGLNQPRVINVSNPESITEKNVNFVSDLSLKERFYVEKKYGAGFFPSGVVQYAFTYSNANLQETNIIYVTPQYYTSYKDRAGGADEKTSNVFYIYLADYSKLGGEEGVLDNGFEKLRIYSIFRTSIDGVPSVKRIAEIDIKSLTYEDSFKKSLLFIDDGMIGEIVDPTTLLYIGGEEIIAGTFTQKNNTLFLGDLELKRATIPDDVKAFFQSDYIKDALQFKTEEEPLTINNSDNQFDKTNQLDLNSESIKTFKYLEWYRFGIQFQHKTGKWSDPIWIKDMYNTVGVKGHFYEKDVHLSYADLSMETTTELQDNLRKLVELGYIRMRPVVVYPTVEDREAVCQGVLCPTVYNVGCRSGNQPFVQSSWFVRPNAPFTINNDDDTPIAKDLSLFPENQFSRKWITANEDTWTTDDNNLVDLVKYGAWLEFRHNRPIPDSDKRNAEIQSIYGGAISPVVNEDSPLTIPTEEEYNIWLKKYSSNYFIDQSIITMHSPDIEFDPNMQTIDTTGLKLRIVGMVPITSTTSDIDIQTETNQLFLENSTKLTPGFVKENVSINNSIYSKYAENKPCLSYYGWRGLVSGVFWQDGYYKHSFNNVRGNDYDTIGYVIYPWHRTGSLNNDSVLNTEKDHVLSAQLKHKVMSNYRFSSNTQYMTEDNIWHAYIDNDDTHTGISEVKVFNSNEPEVYALKGPENSGLGTIFYQGNIDQIISPMSTYRFRRAKAYFKKVKSKSSIRDFFNRVEYITEEFDGYPIFVVDGYYYKDLFDWRTNLSLFSRKIKPISEVWRVLFEEGSGFFVSDLILAVTGIAFPWELIPGIDDKARPGYGIWSDMLKYDTAPISMRYKSTPHAIMALNYSTNHKINILPSIKDDDGMYVNAVNGWEGANQRYFWQKKGGELEYRSGTYQDYLDTGIYDKFGGNSLHHGFLWLGELYRDFVPNRFGGTSDSALQSNQWLPCGEPVNILTENGSIIDTFNLKYTEGDTYYQRYDHLKTYPFSNIDTNSIVDIVSFMCETRVNIAGRTDKMQGNFDYVKINAENKESFNMLNEAYTQKNNFYNYRIQSENVTKLNKFRNTITWTKTKIAGEDIDQWTNITLASTLDLDGNKGFIRALRKVNDSILAFQDKSISQVLFNEQMQVSTDKGVPIEISNSGKVTGYRTLHDNIGSVNKWSMCSTPSGLFFIDDINKDIYRFSNNAENISDQLGFHSWINKTATTKLWNPVDFDNMVTYYDPVTDDVYFITKNEALGMNLPLAVFTSFYSYENTPYMISLPHKTISLHNENDYIYSTWLQNAGEYNMYFGAFQPFYTHFIMNKNPMADKIFDNIFFTSDTWDSSGNLLKKTFDTLKTWNEYQEGETTLIDTKDRPSSLKKKFRVWRANVPRDKTHKRDRMRNTWLDIKLSREEFNTDKTILHDIIVRYFS